MAEIRQVELFLASSIKEFSKERDKLHTFVEELEELYKDRVKLHCILCEHHVGTSIARPRLRFSNPARWICLWPTMETSCDLPAWRRTRR